MTNGLMTGHTGRFDLLIRQDRPEDPKRWAVVRSTQGLLTGFLILCAASAYQIVTKGDIGGGTVAVLIGLGGSAAGLAGYAHKKPDDPMPGGPTA